MMFATMRAAMVATMLVSASAYKIKKFGSSAWNGEQRVGFFIYGGDLKKLPVSQDERIHAAFNYATGIPVGSRPAYPHAVLKDMEHVYIVSGRNAEAVYMKKALKRLYEEANLEEPEVYLEPEAKFTVDNVLKSLPIINNLNLGQLCAVTSDYHRDRAVGILDVFQRKGLVPIGIAAPIVIAAKHDAGSDTKFLEESFDEDYICAGCEHWHAKRIDEIKCPDRDVKNAAIFCDYINKVNERGLNLEKDVKITEEGIQNYLKYNKKTNASTADKEKCFNDFKTNVQRFVDDMDKFQRQRRTHRLESCEFNQ